MRRWAVFLLAPMAAMASQLTFVEVLRGALNNNEELKSKELSVAVAQEDYKMASAMAWGGLTLGINAGQTNNALHVFGSKLASREATFADFGFDQFLSQMNSINTSAGQAALLGTEPDKLNNPDARTNIETTVTYELPLFVGFKLSAAKSMADLQRRASEVKLKRDRSLLAREVFGAYNGAVAAKEFIAAMKKAQEATQSFIKLASNMSDAGMALRSDVLEAKSHDADVAAKMVEAKNNFNMALAYLRFLSGRNDLDDVSDFASLAPDNSDLAQMQKEALVQRDDLSWMKLNVQTMREKVTFEEADRYPMVGLIAKYGYNDNSFTVSTDKDYYMIGVGLTYSIFDAGKRSAQTQKARVEYNKMDLMQRYMEKGVALEVERSMLDYRAKQEVVAQKKIGLDLAEEVLDQTKVRYENSMVTMSVLLLKEAEAQRARVEWVKARYDAMNAAADLTLARGIDMAKGE